MGRMIDGDARVCVSSELRRCPGQSCGCCAAHALLQLLLLLLLLLLRDITRDKRNWYILHD